MEKRKHRSMTALPVLLCAASLTLCWLSSCDNSHQDTISIKADPETFPTMRTLQVSTFISDSGYTRYHITAPVWLMFEEAKEPNWKFPDGLHIVKFDDAMNENGTLVCDSATYLSARRLWRLDSNVRMKNVDGDRFLTEQLFWDQNSHKVYSDSFIHIERSDRIIEGYGFESNEQMTEYTVRQPSGIFPVQDFGAKEAADSAKPKEAPAAPAPTPAPQPQPAAAVQKPQPRVVEPSTPPRRSMRNAIPKPAQAIPDELAR